jgi:putative inorganic carbon (HCO3(-)) transporter
LIYESIIIKFILKFSNTARIKYKQSLTAALINSCLKFLHNLLIESYIYNMVAREGKISGLWYSGRIYLSLEKFCTGIQHKLINTNLRCVDYLKSGIFYRILCTIASYTHVIMAVSIFIMLVVPHSVWNDAYDPIIAAIMLILFLMKIATGGKSQFHIQFINFYLFVFMLSVVLSEIFSISPLSSLKFFIFYLTCFLLVLLLISSISSIKELEQVIFIILLGVLLAGIYGVYQGIVGVPVNPSEVDLNLNQDMPGRVFSTFFNTNNFAEVLAMLLPFGIACFLNSSYFKRKLFTFIILIPPVIALLMTYSRSIWVGFAAALLIITFFKNKKLVPVFMVLLLLMLPLLPQSIYRRVLTITNFQDSSIKFRFDLYTTLWPVLKDYWLT